MEEKGKFERYLPLVVLLVWVLDSCMYVYNYRHYCNVARVHIIRNGFCICTYCIILIMYVPVIEILDSKKDKKKEEEEVEVLECKPCKKKRYQYTDR